VRPRMAAIWNRLARHAKEYVKKGELGVQPFLVSGKAIVQGNAYAYAF